MKLVIDAREAELPRVGVSVYARNIIPEIVRQAPEDWEIILLANGDLSALPVERARVLSCAPEAGSSAFSKLRWYYTLPRLLRQLKADVYFGPTVSVPFAGNLPCPHVCTVHDTASVATTGLVGGKFRQLLNRWLVGKSLRRASRVICISQFCLRQFSEFFGAWLTEKATVVYHGLPPEVTQTDPKRGAPGPDGQPAPASEGARYLFTVGTVSPKKNIARLIEAFELIDDPDLELKIAGALPPIAAEILERAAQSSRQDAISFLGPVSDAELEKLYRGADVFVFPSLHEGFGLPMLEAFKLGVPVACANNTCLPEIAGADSAIFFDPFESREIADAISMIRHDANKRAQIVSAAKNRVQHFTWAKSGAGHIAVFEAAGHRTEMGARA